MTKPVAKKSAVDIAFVRSRLKVIREVLKDCNFSSLRFGPLAFLQKEIDRGTLRNLTAELRPLDARVMDFAEGKKGRVLVLAKRFMEAASKVAEDRKLTRRRIIWMVDNFLIHELLHEAQGMGGGRHSDLRLHSPQTLLSIDYQADAAAVVVATILAWLAPRRFGFATIDNDDDHWTLYAEGIAAVTNQIEIFTYLSKRDLDRVKVAEMPISPERLQRIAAWHFQFHRVNNFDKTLSLADFQILLQPGIDFRNVATAGLLQPSALKSNWPRTGEQEFLDWLEAEESRRSCVVKPETRAPLILSSSSPTGTTRFVRFNPATASHYEDAFVGFFTADMEKSRRFFESLLRDCEWATGRNGAVTPARRLTQHSTSKLAIDLTAKRRTAMLEKLLLRPENYSLVFAE